MIASASRRTMVLSITAMMLTALTACSTPADRPSRVTPKVVIGDIPCAPNKVLHNVCQHCHTDPPVNDAPFPLVTFGNIQSELDGHPIWFWMDKYVTAGIMPLPPVEISDDERATLLKWLRAGAPAATASDSCEVDAGVDSSNDADGSADPSTDAWPPIDDDTPDAESALDARDDAEYEAGDDAGDDASDRETSSQGQARRDAAGD